MWAIRCNDVTLAVSERKRREVSPSGSALVCAHISALLRLSVCPARAHTRAHTHTLPRALSHSLVRARTTQGGGVYKAARGGHTTLRLKHFRPQAARLRSREYKYQPRQEKKSRPRIRVRSLPRYSLACFYWNTEAAALEEVGSKLSGV